MEISSRYKRIVTSLDFSDKEDRGGTPGYSLTIDDSVPTTELPFRSGAALSSLTSKLSIFSFNSSTGTIA